MSSGSGQTRVGDTDGAGSGPQKSLKPNEERSDSGDQQVEAMETPSVQPQEATHEPSAASSTLTSEDPPSPQLGSNNDENTVLHSIAFNQDGGCLSVGTGRGFRVCNVWPFGETFRREGGLFGDVKVDAAADGSATDNNDTGTSSAETVSAASTENENEAHDLPSTSAGGGSIGLVSMLYRTNLLALTSTTPPPVHMGSSVTHSMHTAVHTSKTGGGTHHHGTHGSGSSGNHLAQVTSPSFPPNKVLIYDDALSRPIGELSFRHRVLGVKLRRDRIVVVLRDRIYVYRFSDLTLVDCVGTGRNEAGLCAISLEGATGSTTSGGARRAGGAATATEEDNAVMVLACPGVVTGQVRLELYGLRKTALINAHESPLAAIQVTNDGTYLLTASERGTVLRLFETGLIKRGRGLDCDSRDGTEATTGKPMREFRRGVERATVTCLAFSLDNAWLACGSDHGTVHIFKTFAEKSDGDKIISSSSPTKKNKSKSATKMLSRVLPTTKKYFLSEEASLAHVRGIPHPMACAFVPDRERSIAVAGTDELGNGCLLIAEFSSSDIAPTDAMAGQHNSNETELSKSGKVRRLGYHRFFRKSTHSFPSKSKRRHQSQALEDRHNNGTYDELLVSGARSEGESNVHSVARKLDDVTFSEEVDGDGFDLVDVA